MDLGQAISQKKAAILGKWFRLIMDTYPLDASGFLGREKDRFANPVGYTISREIEVLYDELLQDMDSEKLAASLDSIIRIRSVQDYPPSEAVSFVFLLKKAIREELGDDISDNQAYADLLAFEARIDKLALLALDIYTKCREKIHQIRLNEVKTETERAFRLLEITRRMHDVPDAEEHPGDGENLSP
ncbi:MAG: RsbRD N-terminal domain-containing protein [Chloroflexi bacterium]|nr:RsbRD N-terminal domain-containing protein [Chloroflexota bacterium]